MSNKMLIDASHPEETRVAVVRGNRIEEFDFESQEKKQLRGNIYLAKVTRVEPSLQAAFIDYGGNRHGFLAFSEIHPDYYQIPVADRQALIEAEAAEARASQAAEDAEDDDGEETEAAKPKRRSRRRGSRKTETAAASDDATVEADASSEEEKSTEIADNGDVAAEVVDGEEATASENGSPEGSSEEDAVAAKPKRRYTRRKKKAPVEEEKIADSEPTAEQQDTDADGDNDSDGDGPKSIAAVVETDSISEPLPDDEGDEDAAEADVSDEASAVEAEKEPPKKRTTRRRKKPAAPQEEKTAAASEETPEDAVAEGEGAPAEEEKVDEAEKPAKPRRRSRKKRPEKANAAESGEEVSNRNTDEDNNDAEQADDEDVESIGQEDALEEAASPRKMRKQYKIQEVVKRRQILLVQVVKEERGNKGAALTTYLSLAGRYSVLMPNTARGGGISRKITNSTDRKRLKAIATELDVPEGMGVILRTAGASRTKVEITRDFQYLMRLWEQVRNLTLSSTAPCLVYEEGSLVKRSIRDLYDKDTGEILVSGEKGLEEAREFMGMLMPSHVKKVKEYKESQAIFAKYGVESQLDNMVSPQVTLKSGGYLVMNQTEALVAVDVNSGRATREHSIENTALQTNLEAAEEVARQLRLRDLAGLIVIDFIDMEERRNNRAVEKKLKECLKNDRARIQVGRISHFGLLEMSRQRIRASVLESTMDVCPHCAGVGYIRSESAIALHVFRALEEHVSRNSKRDATVRTTPDIATHILNHKRAALVELEQKFGLQITILGESQLHGQQFEIEKGEKARASRDHAAIGYDSDSEMAAHQAPDTAESDSGEHGRKRSRSRKSRGKSEGSEAGQTEASNNEALQDASTVEGNDEDQPRRKRRRGKRGGSRRKETDASAADVLESETQDTEATSDVGQTTTENTDAGNAIEHEAEPAEEAKPARRSTRRRKAPVNSPEPVAEETHQTESSDSKEAEATSTEPPRPKRRTTRRKPAKDEVKNDVLAAEVTGQPMVEEPVEASGGASTEMSDSGDAEPEKKSKRSGWWSRGGGFF
ncbi:MAG: Rne/Rng family ribonuclease [Pseudomonadota bacterium]